MATKWLEQLWAGTLLQQYQPVVGTVTAVPLVTLVTRGAQLSHKGFIAVPSVTVVSRGTHVGPGDIIAMLAMIGCHKGTDGPRHGDVTAVPSGLGL